MVFGRNPPAPKNMVQGSSIDIADFMKGMQKKDKSPAEEPSPTEADSQPPTTDDVASTFDFADAADFTMAPSTDPTSAFDFIKGAETHPSPPQETSRPPPPKVQPAHNPGGSTAADIMRQGQPAGTPQKAKPKQSLFGKARPKGAAAFMRKLNEASPGPSALDQMLAIVQTAGYRPESAPVMQVAPGRSHRGPPATSQTTETDPQDIRQYCQQYPLAFPDPDFA
jgi:hypothetical protein